MMMKHVELNGRLVGLGQPAYIIAEAGINHNGDLDIAKQMIKAAKEAGVDAVKFQTFTAQNIMTKTAGSSAHLKAGAGKEDVYSFVERISLDVDAHKELQKACEAEGLPFISTAGASEGVDILEAADVPFYKIASMDLNNLPLLDYIGRTGKPIIMSTGMGTLGEVEQAVSTLRNAGNEQILLLHCTVQYPPQLEDVNLRAMDTLKAAFGLPVGYSDHTVGNAVSIASVARGACCIEKHFTLDKTMPGPDQSVSGDPEDFKNLVDDIRAVEVALGSAVKKPVEAEWEMRRNFRRSIVSAQEIQEGAKITREMLVFKRPGSGISPADINWIIGRIATRTISADSVLDQADLV